MFILIHFPNNLAKKCCIVSASFFSDCVYACVHMCVFFKGFFLGFFFGSLNMKFGPNNILS